jgi:hypothetical protein
MRTMPPKSLEACRVRSGPYASDKSYGLTGMFLVPLPSGATARVLSSDGEGWDHVSISLADRCPSWEEMCHVKDLFFEEQECVVQYHPPRSEYVNLHPFCLHLWKPQGALPRPPRALVG